MSTELTKRDPTIMEIVSQLANATTPTLEQVQVIERLLAMQERAQDRDAKRLFMDALADLQAEAPSIEKRGVIKSRNGELRSRYVLIEDIEDIYKPLMEKYGFSMTVSVVGIKDGMREFSGLLMHRAGHEKCLSVFLPLDANDSRSKVQSEGSTMSYAKRMLYKAHFNISEKGVDDDGTGVGLDLITKEQLQDLEALLTEVKGNRNVFLQLYDIETLDQLPTRYYSAAIATLEEKRKGKK